MEIRGCLAYLLKGSPRAFGAWPPAWPLPSGPLGRQGYAAAWKVVSGYRTSVGAGCRTRLPTQSRQHRVSGRLHALGLVGVGRWIVRGADVDLAASLCAGRARS
jgi:hypothetical protein